jgi:hypothetical protein
MQRHHGVLNTCICTLLPFTSYKLKYRKARSRVQTKVNLLLYCAENGGFDFGGKVTVFFF